MERNAVWKIINQVPILLITFYRTYISPLSGPTCRFYPTCSQYALEAFQSYNFFYATLLTVWRVLRCNPFSKGGYDPLPRPGRTINSNDTKT